MKIMAFLQNQWVRDPDRLKATIDRLEAHEPGRGERYRRKFVHYALFSGCLTGKRLKVAFGNLCDQIIWEEGSKEIGRHAGAFFPPDYSHILGRIKEEKPHIALVFGKSNIEIFAKSPAFHVIVDEVVRPLRVIDLPHPAARINNIQTLLNEGAEKCRKLMEKYATVS